MLHTFLYPALRLFQPSLQGLERPGPVGIRVLAFAHLGVSERRPLGNEYGIVAEPAGTSRFLGHDPRNFTPKGAHVPVRLRERDDAHGLRTTVLIRAEHPEQALVADTAH